MYVGPRDSQAEDCIAPSFYFSFLLLIYYAPESRRDLHKPANNLVDMPKNA